MIFNKSVEVFGGIKNSWIGINDMNAEGVYVFTRSVEKIVNFVWGTSQPTGAKENCNSFGFDVGHSKKWTDRPCSEINYFICEVV